MKRALLVLLAAVTAWTPSFGAGPEPSVPAALSRKALYPEDLGPADIDVSSYPAELQAAYRDIFVPVFSFLCGTARIVNSPVIELDPAAAAELRRSEPGLFEDPRVAAVSADGWKRKVKEVRDRPPCCGACPVLSSTDAKALYKFLVYDSRVRKTGARGAGWLRQRRELLERFKKEHPERYNELYSPSRAKENQR